MGSNEKPKRFEIAAAVVFRLGAELITDVVQALVELVKNSYDADASWAHVTITTPKSSAAEGSMEAVGEITIEDDGQGMNADDFERGWLMIADSPKKAMKDSGETTSLRGRTPIGDKGLGRLGVQRLGHNIEIISRVADAHADEYRLAFSWRDFEQACPLSEVPVVFHPQARSRQRSGTRIIVRDLKDPEQWIGDGARSKLQKSLSELISPFREVREFRVTVTIDGEDVPIVEITERVRDTAVVRYELSFDGHALRVTGKVRLDFVTRAQKKEDQLLLQALLRKDEGRAFFEYLLAEAPRGRPPKSEYHDNSKWFVSFQYDLALSDLGGVRLVDDDVANPGPFHGEVDYLLLDSDDVTKHIWDNASDYKRHVDELAGIRVYRDGFGIRVGEDWLKLGRQQTSGGSMYGLRPKNVIGFIAIGARDNRSLLETTSREGFQKTSHYLNFYAMLQKFVQWSAQAQEYFRRGALDFLKKSRTLDAGLEVGGEIQSAVEKLRKQAVSIDLREQKFVKARDSMRQLTKVAKAQVQELTEDDEQFSLYHQEKLKKVNELVSTLGDAVERIQQTLYEHQPEATTISQAQQILDVVLERDTRLHQELEMFYEGVALGLTAEVLSHEIAGVAERLAQRSSTLSIYISRQQNRDDKVLAFVEHVKSSVAALRKQLAHIDPSLRYVREHRELVELAGEIQGIRDFFKERFAGHGISMSVRAESTFKVRINRGKLNQIFDNMLLNSEYWLREVRRKDATFSGAVILQIDRPILRIWDNGPGIALSVEDNLFDPFVTTKEQGKGRGLGLFIVRQLLDAEGCSIRLLPERNGAGRRFKFEIDLRGALNE